MLLSPTLKIIKMNNEIDYLVADENCKQAIKELMFDANRLKWLKKHKRLFDKISLSPKELPNVANASFNGVVYGFIKDFHKEYSLVLLEITN
jgi:hypothetical protein